MMRNTAEADVKAEAVVNDEAGKEDPEGGYSDKMNGRKMFQVIFFGRGWKHLRLLLGFSPCLTSFGDFVGGKHTRTSARFGSGDHEESVQIFHSSKHRS